MIEYELSSRDCELCLSSQGADKYYQPERLTGKLKTHRDVVLLDSRQQNSMDFKFL